MSEQAIKEILKRQLVNLVPIPKGSGKALTQSWKNYQTERYLDQVPDDQDFAVICGTVSDNLVVFDFDHCDNLDLLNEIIPDALNQTLVVKSGNGFHLYTKFNGQMPPTKQWLKKNGQTIEVQTHGFYVVGPSCDYYAKDESGKYIKTDKKYQVISYTTTIREVNPLEISQRIRNNGWSTDKTIIDNGGREYIPTDELTNGGWQKGERNPKGVMLGVRRFHAGWNFDQVLAEALTINKTCNPIADYSYVEAWVTQAYNLHKKNIQSGFYADESTPQKQEEKEKSEKISKSKAIIDNTAELIKSKYSFVTPRETDEVLLYDSKIYNKAKAEAIIKEEADKIIEDSTTHDRNEVLNKIKVTTGTDLENFDSDPKLITLENGILDLDNLELRPHTPENLSRVLIPVEFEAPLYEIKDESIFEDIEKNLENTLFYQFLKRSFTVNKEFRKDDFETVLEIIASPMIKRQIDEKAFMFLGGGENGKSVCLDYVRLLYGDKNISRVPLQALAEDKFMAAELVGKSANVFTDLEAGEMKHTGKIKAITSGEGLQAQEKYKNPFTLTPFAKMMFSCNRFPKIYDQSQGFFRRWVIVTWERNFENDSERDPLLRGKLAENQEERNLVFSCLVYLARRLNKIGKFTHSKDWKTTQREWNENADPLDYFVTNYVIDSTGNRSIRDTYQHYKQVMLMKGETPLGVGQFGKVFAEYFEQWVEKDEEDRTHRVWLNIDLKPIELGDYSK